MGSIARRAGFAALVLGVGAASFFGALWLMGDDGWLAPKGGAMMRRAVQIKGHSFNLAWGLPADQVARARGKLVTIRANFKTNADKAFCLQIDDGVGAERSEFADAGVWQVLSVSKRIDPNAKRVSLRFASVGALPTAKEVLVSDISAEGEGIVIEASFDELETVATTGRMAMGWAWEGGAGEMRLIETR